MQLKFSHTLTQGLLLSLLALNSPAFAQVRTSGRGPLEIADGDEHFRHHNYLMALPVYKELLKNSPGNTELQYKIALCYLNTHINKLEATKYLEAVVKDPKCDPEAWFQLGHVYHLAGRFDDAVPAYEKFMSLMPSAKERAKHQIASCGHAKALIAHPINVTFTNAGKEINSPYADYYPFITKDEMNMVFTSRRKENLGNLLESDGYYSSDVYMSNLANGKWTKARNAGTLLNTDLDEQAVGISPDGSEILIYQDHIETYGDLYVSKKNRGSFYLKPELIAGDVNKYTELSACMNDDKSILFFARKENDKGNTDIYMSRKLPNGNWGTPFSLGKGVNTPYNEDFPFISADGKTLYFSSEGHNSMGGFDLFKSVWDDSTASWSFAQNLGYPLNTPDDEYSICITPDESVAYVSAIRPGGEGDLDIYRVKFNDSDAKYCIIKGHISLPDSATAMVSAVVKAVDTKNKTYYLFSANINTGTCLIALPAGVYSINISSDGYKEIIDTLIISDLGLNMQEVNRQFKLEKK